MVDAYMSNKLAPTFNTVKPKAKCMHEYIVTIAFI